MISITKPLRYTFVLGAGIIAGSMLLLLCMYHNGVIAIHPRLHEIIVKDENRLERIFQASGTNLYVFARQGDHRFNELLATTTETSMPYTTLIATHGAKVAACYYYWPGHLDLGLNTIMEDDGANTSFRMYAFTSPDCLYFKVFYGKPLWSVIDP